MAVVNYKKSLALDDQNSEVHLHLGSALYAQNRYYEAEYHFSKAAELQP